MGKYFTKSIYAVSCEVKQNELTNPCKENVPVTVINPASLLSHQCKQTTCNEPL